MPSGSKKRKAARLKAQQQQQSLPQTTGIDSCSKLSETGNPASKGNTSSVGSDGPGESRMGAPVASIHAACDGQVDMNAASEGKELPTDGTCLPVEPEESEMICKNREEGMVVISGEEPEKLCNSIVKDNGVMSGPVHYNSVRTGHELQLCKAIVELQTRSNMPNKVSLASPAILCQDMLQSSGRDMVEAANVYWDNNGRKASLPNDDGKTFVESMHRHVANGAFDSDTTTRSNMPCEVPPVSSAMVSQDMFATSEREMVEAKSLHWDAIRKPCPPDEQAKTSVQSMDRDEVNRTSDSDPTTGLGAVSEKIEELMTNDASISVSHKPSDYNIHAADSTSSKEYSIRVTSKNICEDLTMHAIVDFTHETHKDHELESSAAGNGGASHSDPSGDVWYVECKTDAHYSLQTNESDGEREGLISETVPSSQQLQIGAKWWGCCGLLDLWLNRY